MRPIATVGRVSGRNLQPFLVHFFVLPSGSVVAGAQAPQSKVDAAKRTHVSRRFAVARAWRVLGVSRTVRSNHPGWRASGPVVR